MALTVAQLLNAIRAAPEGEVVSAQLTAIGTRLLAVGRALVDTYAPLAPEDVRDEAVIRVAGYLYDAPNVTRSGVAWNESGAHALVDPWVQRGVAPVDFDLTAVAAASQGAGVDEDAVEAIVRRLVADWAEADSSAAVPEAKLPSDSTAFIELGSFVFNASGTTFVDSNIALPAAGWIIIDFDGGRTFWIDSAKFRLGRAQVAGAAPAAGDSLQFPGAIGHGSVFIDIWLGHTAAQNILVSNRRGSGATGFSVYRVSIGSSSGGLTQAQVDARIGARVEAWATQGSGDTPAAADLADNPNVGQVLKAASDGDAEWANESGGLTQAQVDARVAAVEGPDPATWAEDGNADQIPANKLANAPSGGGGLTQAQVDARVQAGVKDKAETGGGKWAYPDDYILPQGLEALNRVMAAGGWEARSGDLQVSGPRAATWNANQATAASFADSVQHGTSQENWYVLVRAANSLGNDPAKFRLNIDDDLYQSLMGVAEVFDSANAMWYYFAVQVSRLPAGAVVTAEYDEDVELGADVDVNAPNVKGNLTDARIAAARVDGLDAAIDQRAPRTAGLVELHNGVMGAPTLVDLSGHRYSVRQATTFDLDDHPQGVFEFEVRLTLSETRVPINLSLASDSVTRTATIEGLLTATALSASAAAANPGAGVGLVQGEASLYSGSALQGKVKFYVAKDANNVVWSYLEYDGEATAVSGNGALTANLVFDFQRSDGGGAAGPSSPWTLEDSSVNNYNMNQTTGRTHTVNTDLVLPADWQNKFFMITNYNGPTFFFRGGDSALVGGYVSSSPRRVQIWDSEVSSLYIGRTSAALPRNLSFYSSSKRRSGPTSGSNAQYMRILISQPRLYSQVLPT